MTNRWRTGLRTALWCMALVVAGCGGSGGSGDTPAAAPLASAPPKAPVEQMTLGSPVDPALDAAPTGRRAATGGSRVALDGLVPIGPLRASRPDEPRRTGWGRDIADTDTAAKTGSRLAWRPTPGGGLAGQITFASPPAVALRLGVLVQRLPAAAMLRFYAVATPQTLEVPAREVLAALGRNRDAGDDSAAARLYWSPQVDGPEITMEIELPPGTAADAVEIAVPRLSHLFRDPLAPAAGGNSLRAIGDAASCEVDVNCQSYGAESNAVARMSFVGTDGGSYWCSGTLLNDRASSGTPYFLTANHCIGRQSVASTLETHWFFRSTACNSRTLDPGTRTLRGGATLLWASAATDTAFLRLAAVPPAGVTYAAWSPNPVGLGTPVAGVHHPRGDLQKISLGSTAAYGECQLIDGSGSFTCTQATQSTGEFVNVQNSLGTTEGGSSGSALFQTIGTSRYVVGQLYGGNSSCSNPAGSNFYGRFDVAYNAALYQWLDGGGSGMALAVTRTGNGQGTVSSAPAGISCGATCTAPFAPGSSVTLTATPAAGSVFTGWSGACTGTGTCVVAMTSARSVVANFSLPVIPLATALDNGNLSWSAGGQAPFAAATGVASLGASAARSGAIGHSQASWLAATVTGPGVLTFDWKVSSEQNYDFLTVAIDGVKQGAASGEAGWTTSALRIPAGTHTVRWQYTKDQAVVSGQDAAWIDRVAFAPDGAASDAARVFNWAEFAFPEFFKGQPTGGTYQDYTYRYYPASGNFLAVRSGRVIVHNGVTWNFVDVGPLGDYLVTASAAGF